MTVDLDAVAANYRLLRDLAAGAACGAVVKADGYGLGLAPVARTLAAEGCGDFFISTLDEGIALRAALDEAGAEATIYVLSGPVAGAAESFDRARLTPILNTPGQIDEWAAHGRDHGGRRAVIKLDSGMARLGLTAAEAGALAAAPERLAGLDIAFVMSHLACADAPDDPMNAAQLAAFGAMRATLPPARASLANSAGIFLAPEYHLDLVRPGAALYGLHTSPRAAGRMAPVVRLQGRILQVRDVDTDSAVGYGATGRVAEGSRLATVAAGYADGYLRSLGNRGSGFVGDDRVPLVGRVSMDLIVFDVTGVPRDRVREGGYIDLIGPHHGADDLAAEAGTIGYEILAALGARYRRAYIGGP